MTNYIDITCELNCGLVLECKVTKCRLTEDDYKGDGERCKTHDSQQQYDSDKNTSRAAHPAAAAAAATASVVVSRLTLAMT